MEEIGCTRIAEYGCHMDLFKIILKKITVITNSDTPVINVSEDFNAINANVDFMRSKDIHPIYKRLVEATIARRAQNLHDRSK